MAMYRLLALSIVLVLSSSQSTWAEVEVASFQFTGTGVVTGPGAPQFEPFLSFGDPNVMPALGFIDNVTMSLVDVLNGTSPDLAGDFANFEALSTNGVNDDIHIGFKVPSGVGSSQMMTESALLAGAFSKAPGVGAPDYAGYDLTRVEVMGTSFQTLPSGGFEVTIAYTVYAERLIPEPATCGMAAMGLAGVILHRWRRRL
jgi:hypothetical protein